MSREFDRPNYNPRYGLKNTGKVREEDFSLMGSRGIGAILKTQSI